MLPAARLARLAFRGERARGLFAGLAGHSILPLTRSLTAAFGLSLGVLGHAVGWPLARGGSQAIADALVSHLRSLGGEVETGRRVTSLDELGDARAVLLDLTPRQFLADRRASGSRRGYRRRLERYRYGPGVFKLDWALDGPIPWRARGVRARGDGAPRRDARGDRRVRARAVARRDGRAAVRAARPADASSTRRARRRGSTRRGRTATSRTARPRT